MSYNGRAEKLLETKRPSKLKMFSSWLFTGQVCPPLDHQEEQLRSCAELPKYKLTSQRQMTTGDNLLYRSKAKRLAESTAAPSTRSCLLASLRLFPFPRGLTAGPKGNVCFKLIQSCICYMSFWEQQIKYFNLSACKKGFLERRWKEWGWGHACEGQHFLCGSEALNSSNRKKVLTFVMQTACDIKNKTHTDESRHVRW